MKNLYLKSLFSLSPLFTLFKILSNEIQNMLRFNGNDNSGNINAE